MFTATGPAAVMDGLITLSKGEHSTIRCVTTGRLVEDDPELRDQVEQSLLDKGWQPSHAGLVLGPSLPIFEQEWKPPVAYESVGSLVASTLHVSYFVTSPEAMELIPD